MDITLPKIDLAAVLARAASVAKQKSTRQVLCCVLLEAKDGALTARANDETLGIETTCNAAVKEPGAVAVDARRAAEIARSMPAGDVRVRVVKNQLEFKNGKSASKIGIFPAEDFPALPTADGATPVLAISGQDMLRLVVCGAYAASTDETRAHMACAHFSPEDEGLRVFATDGHRLATAIAQCEVHVKRHAANDFLIHNRGTAEIKDFAKTAKDQIIRVSRTSSNVFFSCDRRVLNVKLLDDGTQPPPSRFVLFESKSPAAKSKLTCTAPRELFLAAIQRVALTPRVCAGGVSIISLTFSAELGECVISGENGSNEGVDSVSVNGAPSMRIDVSPDYLSAAMAAVYDDEVTIGLSSELEPIVIRSGDDYHVVMPMRQ